MEVTLLLRGVLRDHAGGRGRMAFRLDGEGTIHELLDHLATELPAVERRVRDETRTIRRHIHVFVDAQDVGAVGGSLRLHDGAEVLVLPAVSGG